MLAALPDEDLSACAAAEAILTHQHPLAGDAAAAVVVLCRALIRGVAWRSAVERAAAGRLAETRAALDAVREGPGNTNGYSPVALRAAVFFVGTSTSFSEALERSLVFAGPPNYCPVLVGAICGARWGTSAIPSFALAHVKLLQRVQDTAGKLASRQGTGSGTSLRCG